VGAVHVIGLPPLGNYMQKEIGAMLGEISQEEVSYGRPMLSALAMSKNESKPGKGFFVLAKDMGKFKGEGDEEDMKPGKSNPKLSSVRHH
jgi:hypothetical protein